MGDRLHKFSHSLICLVIACMCIVLNFSCSSDGTGDTYPIVVFSDVHFSPFYDPTIFQQLNNSDASDWADIFASSDISEPSAYGNDSNYPLLALTLSSIQQNIGRSPMIIFTDDILGHNFASQFYSLYGSEDAIAMQAFADKTVSFFTTFVKSHIGNISVMFVLGNADSYTSNGPDSTFLSNTAETFYSNWIGAAANRQTFLNTYTAGGYYSASPLGNYFEVIALNTFPLSTQATGDNSAAVEAQLAWLNSTLASAKNSAKKVLLLMHTPTGIYASATAEMLDSSGRLSTASMMMVPEYQTSLLQIISDYSDIITMTLGAHTHMDEFRLISTDTPLMITAGITPVFDNNPAYKIFSFANGRFIPSDYISINYNLAAEPQPSNFDEYYTFSTAYLDSIVSSDINDALVELFPDLNTNETDQAQFRTYYYSGSSASSTITDTNWKVFWCAIAEMTEEDIIGCVNSES